MITIDPARRAAHAPCRPLNAPVAARRRASLLSPPLRESCPKVASEPPPRVPPRQLGEETPKDVATLQPEALFSTLNSFCASLSRAHTTNLERAEMERKRARLAEAAAHQADIMGQISARRAKISSGKLKSTKSTKGSRSRAASGVSRQPSDAPRPSRQPSDAPRPSRQPSSPKAREGSGGAATRRKGPSMLRLVGRTIIVMNDLKKWA